MERVIGIGLAAGSGVRFRPLSLKAGGYLRAKAAVQFLGRRILEWVIDDLHRQGVDDYVMVTKGKENRFQIKNILGYGESSGITMRYSPVRYDHNNTGSADAVLTNLENFQLDGTAVIFPTDSVFDFDLSAMLDAHRQSGAVVTIAAALQPAEAIADRYGLLDATSEHRVREFVEKPSLAEIYTRYGVTERTASRLPSLPTNAGLYLADATALREICRHPDIVAMRKRQCDIGGDLLPWLVAHGYLVQTFAIDRMGDLGNIPCYLETMVDALHARFTSLALSPCPLTGHPGLMIDPTTLNLRDPISRLTLAEKIECGLVDLRAPVRIGKYVQIFPGVTLAACNIDDECEVYENATITHSSIGAGSLIGPSALIEQTLTGIMVDVQSTAKAPVSLRGTVALGDEVVVQRGVTLENGASIYPRLCVPAGAHFPPHAEIENDQQLLATLGHFTDEPLELYLTASRSAHVA